MNLTSIPLVITDAMGFPVFAHPDGRFSAAVKVNGVRYFARDYRHLAVAAGKLEQGPVEPGELEFVAALVRQGKRR